MQLDKKYKLHYACSDDEFRPVLKSIRFEKGEDKEYPKAILMPCRL